MSLSIVAEFLHSPELLLSLLLLQISLVQTSPINCNR